MDLTYSVTVTILTMIILTVTYSSAETMSLFMPSMTINTSLLHHQCPYGNLSNLTINTAFAYKGQPLCSHNSDPIFPVELTKEVERLLTYREMARKKYGKCIEDRSCDIVDLSEWKQLAHSQYKMCDYCSSYDGQQCTDSVVVKRGQHLSDILASMYLYVRFDCELSPNNERLLAKADVQRIDEYEFKVILNTSQIECGKDDNLEIKHVLERVSPVAYWYEEKYQPLMNIFNKSFLDSKYKDLMIAKVNTDDWSTVGGYYWGDEKNAVEYPHTVLISYSCEKGETMNDRSPKTSTDINSSGLGSVTLTIIIATISTVVVAISIVTIVITLLMRRQKRKHIFMTVS